MTYTEQLSSTIPITAPLMPYFSHYNVAAGQRATLMWVVQPDQSADNFLAAQRALFGLMAGN